MTQLGVSGGLVCSGKGTLGVLLRHPQGPERYLLGCSHVLANSGHWPLPFPKVPPTRLVVQQPMTCDPNQNRVGVLQAPFSIIVSKDEGTTSDDFAVALLDPAVAANLSNVQVATGNFIQDFAREHPGEWQPGMKTKLLGAVHQGADGEIIGYRGEEAESITFPGVGEVNFTGLVRYQTPCAEGDSGGAIIDDHNRLLGIHIAGDPTQEIGVFLPVGDYLVKNNYELG